jgi:hypothetical protein
MKRTSLVALLVVFTGLSVLGAPPNQDSGSRQMKEPWEWTENERIVARLDPSFVKANSHPRANTPGGYVAAQGISTDLVLVIDGSKTPEMFLPSELFTNLLDAFQSNATFREGARTIYQQRIITFGFKDPHAFWSELEKVIAPHLALMRDAASLDTRIQEANARDRNVLVKNKGDLDVALCRSRFRAMTSARAHFGQETFDRFLYTVVAPNLKKFSAIPGAGAASGYAYVESGCR